MDASDMRLSNSNLVLKLLWQHQTVSRADLARLTGMSRPSISAIVAEQLELGLISEVGPGESNGGRRPVLLRFEDDAHYIAGLDLGATHIGLMLTNLRGQEVEWFSTSAETHEKPEQTIHKALELLREGLAAARQKGRKVIGLGIGVPSPIFRGHAGQTLHPAIYPRWVGVELSRILRESVSIPVFLENDANLGALAELWWTERRSRKHLVYLKVASGLGAGVIIQGKIFGGAHGLAGELGHTYIQSREDQARSPLEENLNARVGINCVLARLPYLAGRPPVSPLERGQALRLAYREGSSEDKEQIHRFLHDLSLAIANAMVSFDPELVIVGGVVPDFGVELNARLKFEISRHLIWPELREIPVELSRFGEKQTALGASTLVLDRMLEDFELFCDARDAKVRMREFLLQY